MGSIAEFGKANGGIDEIAQDDLAGFHVTGNKAFDTLTEKRLAKTGITLYAGPDGFLEITLLPLDGG